MSLLWDQTDVDKSGTLDQDELAALVVGTMGFLKDKFKAEQKTAKVELDKQLKEAKKDPLMGAMAEAMLAPMAKMLEAMFEQSIKNFDETIKHPEQAVAELKAALDEDKDGTITKEEFLKNGADALFKGPCAGMDKTMEGMEGSMEMDCSIM